MPYNDWMSAITTITTTMLFCIISWQTQRKTNYSRLSFSSPSCNNCIITTTVLPPLPCRYMGTLLLPCRQFVQSSNNAIIPIRQNTGGALSWNQNQIWLLGIRNEILLQITPTKYRRRVNTTKYLERQNNNCHKIRPNLPVVLLSVPWALLPQ